MEARVKHSSPAAGATPVDAGDVGLSTSSDDGSADAPVMPDDADPADAAVMPDDVAPWIEWHLGILLTILITLFSSSET